MDTGAFLFRTRISIPTEVKTTMPNAKVLSEKKAIVAQLTEKIQKATAGVIAVSNTQLTLPTTPYV